MKIKSKTHGYLDYIVGVLLIASPWIFDFYRSGPESWVPIILGASAIVYSLITDYELGAARILPYRAHLALDIISGIVLAASPWLFGFAEQVYVPHLVFGLLEIGVATFSSSRTSIETRAEDKRHYDTGRSSTPGWT
jgi:hypothetical protein